MPIEIDYFDFEKYTKFFKKLEQASRAQVVWVLTELEDSEFQQFLASDRVKSLGNELFELRISKRPEVLVRIFFWFDKTGRLVVLHAYDKKKNNKISWQRIQIAEARKIVKLLR